MADKYATGNSALFQVRQYKEATPRNQSGPSNYSKDDDRKRKQDRMVANTKHPTRRKPVTQDDFDKMLDGPCLLHDRAHKARECFTLKNFAHHALKVCKERPWSPKGGRKDSDKDNQDEDKEYFQDPEQEVNYICGRSMADSKR